MGQRNTHPGAHGGVLPASGNPPHADLLSGTYMVDKVGRWVATQRLSKNDALAFYKRHLVYPPACVLAALSGTKGGDELKTTLLRESLRARPV